MRRRLGDPRLRYADAFIIRDAVELVAQTGTDKVWFDEVEEGEAFHSPFKAYLSCTRHPWAITYVIRAAKGYTARGHLKLTDRGYVLATEGEPPPGGGTCRVLEAPSSMAIDTRRSERWRTG